MKIGKQLLEITFVEHTKLTAMVTELTSNDSDNSADKNQEVVLDESLKRKLDDSTGGTPAKTVKTSEDEKKKDSKKDAKASDIMVKINCIKYIIKNFCCCFLLLLQIFY